MLDFLRLYYYLVGPPLANNPYDYSALSRLEFSPALKAQRLRSHSFLYLAPRKQQLAEFNQSSLFKTYVGGVMAEDRLAWYIYKSLPPCLLSFHFSPSPLPLFFLFSSFLIFSSFLLFLPQP